MYENFVLTGAIGSILIASIAVYIILYWFKWASGWRLFWQGILVNLVWAISLILSFYFTFTQIIERFRLGFRQGLVFILAISILIPTLFTIGILFLLKRFRKASAMRPHIVLPSVLIGVIALAIFAGGMMVTMNITDAYFPPEPQTGE